jgi:hypothetical protein
LQIRLAINAQHALYVDNESVATQKDRQSPEAEAAALGSKFFESCTQLSVVLSNPVVPNHPAINSQISARLAFADVELIPSRLHDSTFLSRR